MSNVAEVNKDELMGIISRNTGIALDEIHSDSSLKVLCDGNVYKLGLILYDIHEKLDQEVALTEDEFLKMFSTVEDIVNYFQN